VRVIGILTRVREHLDTIVVLFLAIIFSALGFIHLASGEALANGILATLAVLSFSFIREQLRREVAEQSLSANLVAIESGLHAFPAQLRHIGDVRRDVAAMRTELDGSAEMQMLTGSLIVGAFADARRNAGWWMFCGGTGTYLRSVTLPELAKESRRSGRIVTLHIQIIDPRNEGLCETYALHRHSADVWPDNGSPWTRDLVRKAAYATILAACWYGRNYGLLKIKLGLAASWSNFRYDLTPSCLLITVRDKGLPAYRVKPEKGFYGYWDTDLKIGFDQTHQVPLDRAPALGQSPTCDEVRDLFAALGLPLDDSYDDDAVRTIITKALYAGTTPYERAQ
jgi:hypothetical protein